jgi:ribosomal-protein-alanine N-acetyltransferase
MREDGIVLETDRLVLRELTFDDLDALAAMYADPLVRRFFPEGTIDREATREEIAWMIEVDYARYGHGLWATVDRDSGATIGRCGLLPFKVVPSRRADRLGLDHPDEDPAPGDRIEVELAYLIARDRWGEGLATEAARAIVDHGFGTLAVDRLICLVDPGNGASEVVAARCGMVLDGEVEIDDEVLPLRTLTRARWERTRGAAR